MITPHYEVKLLRKDGSWFYGEINAKVINLEGEPGIQVWVRDITTRKQAEEALRDSEEKYRLLVENATDAIFIAQDEVVKFPNPKTEEMIGYTKEELATIPFVDLIHPGDRAMVLERHRRRLQGEELPSPYSFRVIRKSGDEVWVHLNTVATIWEGRPATLNFLRDITEQRRLESQLRYAQRMEALGTLGGGIAHDFNNLLMSIQGNASLMLLDKDTIHPDYERLKNIEQYVQDGADLTKQLLGFARGGRYDVKPTDLNKIVKKSADMFGRTKKEITIHAKYQQDIWASEVDQAQIEQVLLNLYINAWQAMPAGGALYLETQNVTLDQDYVKPFDMKPGRFVKISITDTGVGMDEETRQRIFEPFFTTKGMGRGTGLGLASVYGIMKNHGGNINVYSEKGEGTTFTMYLPATEKKPIEERQLPKEIQKGTETILLVDDEEAVLAVGEKILMKLGYTVITARGGKEAIQIYEKDQEKIDLVILDMIMPGMGGGETYDRMKEMNPPIKVLLSSGYSINGQAEEILKRGCNGFIQKPFTMRELSQRIREIVEKE
jgi:two-component system cell cycle sensor histidine kinase/response regulator CckA